jgi:hypothetical protein
LNNNDLLLHQFERYYLLSKHKQVLLLIENVKILKSYPFKFPFE